MRAHEIYNSQQLEEGFGSLQYGSWIIKFDEEPYKGQTFRAMAYLMDRNKPVASVKANADTKEQVIADIKSQIDAHQEERRAQIKDKIKVGDVSQTAINFNVAMSKSIFNGLESTAARFVADGGELYIDIARQEAYREDPASFRSDGFVKMSGRNLSKKGGTEAYQIGITPSKVDRLGLDFNGRYVLDDRPKSPEPDRFQRFRPVYDSTSQGPQDKKELAVPAFTVATWEKKDKDASV